MTYTFATMEVPRFVHALVRQLLLDAKYDHVVDDAAGTLDMTHIALVAGDGPDPLEEMRVAKDGAYLERNRVVAALACCFPAGVGRTAIEGWDPEWHNVVYIDLPTGQVSWHFHDDHEHLFARLPKYVGTWDGHDTPEKYRRLGELRLQAVGDPPSGDGALALLESTANVLRGMTLDPEIPEHMKGACAQQAAEIDAFTDAAHD